MSIRTCSKNVLSKRENATGEIINPACMGVHRSQIAKVKKAKWIVRIVFVIK